MNVKNLIVAVFALIELVSCERIEKETDPHKLILGKWVLIEIGSGNLMEPVDVGDSYIAYLPDSIKLEFSTDFPGYNIKIYWIDTLLRECIYLRDEHRCLYTERFKFEFFDSNDKLKLVYSNISSIYSTFIYKRLK